VGRPKLDMIFISVKFPPKLVKRLDRIKEFLGISKSDVIRTAVEKEATELEKKIEKMKKKKE
jgi:metal-responsive CopG/Arc/MetJ family transcriptional regulator